MAYGMEDRMARKGTVNEASLFGDNTQGPGSYRYQDALKKHPPQKDKMGRAGYLPFNEALALVREAQTQDPMNPQRKFMRDVRDAVIKRLRLDPKDAAKNLGIYSAIRTPLDSYHGVDAFIELRANDGGAKLVTMDATLNQEKLEADRAKANVLIGEAPEHIDHPKEYQDFIDKIADQIVAHLKDPAH